jgi:hypothetical protein
MGTACILLVRGYFLSVIGAKKDSKISVLSNRRESLRFSGPVSVSRSTLKFKR